MNKELEVTGIKRMEIELQDLGDRLKHTNNIEEETYLTYRFELLKRDIHIEQLIQPAIQKLMLSPLPPIYIKQVLTPPTAGDVCKALSVYFGEEARYDNDKRVFMFTDGNRKGGHITGSNKYHNTYAISGYALPPHLITMIGRFYESLETK